MSKIEVIINAGGGSFIADHTEQQLREAFDLSGLDVNLRFARSGTDVAAMTKEAVESSAEIVVAGGGDGTINTVASSVAEAGKVLGVIPLGTLNHFSKDLKIPQDIPGAIGVLSDNQIRKVDVGAKGHSHSVDRDGLSLGQPFELCGICGFTCRSRCVRARFPRQAASLAPARS